MLDNIKIECSLDSCPLSSELGNICCHMCNVADCYDRCSDDRLKCEHMKITFLGSPKNICSGEKCEEANCKWCVLNIIKQNKKDLAQN